MGMAHTLETTGRTHSRNNHVFANVTLVPSNSSASPASHPSPGLAQLTHAVRHVKMHRASRVRYASTQS